MHVLEAQILRVSVPDCHLNHHCTVNSFRMKRLNPLQVQGVFVMQYTRSNVSPYCKIQRSFFVFWSGFPECSPESHHIVCRQHLAVFTVEELVKQTKQIPGILSIAFTVIHKFCCLWYRSLMSWSGIHDTRISCYQARRVELYACYI